MTVRHSVQLNNEAVVQDNVLLPGRQLLSVEDLYRDQHWSYPKFFKMDRLCKWAWAGAELLLSSGSVYKDLDKNKIGIVLSTSQGCLEVDKRYFDTIDVPSPALFVYTLPNIMLGEICIRHGLKGAQLCTVSDRFDFDEMQFAVNSLLNQQGMDAVLCGWADVSESHHNIQFYWMTR